MQHIETQPLPEIQRMRKLSVLLHDNAILVWVSEKCLDEQILNLYVSVNFQSCSLSLYCHPFHSANSHSIRVILTILTYCEFPFLYEKVAWDQTREKIIYISPKMEEFKLNFHVSIHCSLSNVGKDSQRTDKLFCTREDSLDAVSAKKYFYITKPLSQKLTEMNKLFNKGSWLQGVLEKYQTTFFLYSYNILSNYFFTFVCSN